MYIVEPIIIGIDEDKAISFPDIIEQSKAKGEKIESTL